jgi:hypothetical protein
MKTFATITFLFSSSILLGQVADNLTAGQIVDSSIRFSGGESRIAKINSSSIIYLLVQPDKSTAIINEKTKTGKKYLQSVLSKTHVPQTTFFDGKVVSRINGSSVVQFDSLEKIEEVKLRTYNQIQYGYKVLGYRLTRLPDKKFQNFDCYVLNARASNGYTTMNFFDKTNYRLLMVIYPNGNKSLMIDYVFKDSILFNSHIINTLAESDNIQELRLQQIHLNIDIADIWFTCPYNKEVAIPPYIRTGKFESTNGEKTVFVRNEKSQEYQDEQDKFIMRRFLKWASSDTYGLIDEKTIQNHDTSPESVILVRIISWNKDGYVCHWIAGEYTDTQDYTLKH